MSLSKISRHLGIAVFVFSLTVSTGLSQIMQEGSIPAAPQFWKSPSDSSRIEPGEETTPSGGETFAMIGAGSAYSSEMIEVDPEASYGLTVWLKMIDSTQPMKAVLALFPIDEEGRFLGSYSVLVVPGTETELTADVNEGDMSVSIKDASTWQRQPYGAPYGAIAFETGENFEDLPNERYAIIESIQGHESYSTLKLRDPVQQEYFPAGTKVRQHLNANRPGETVEPTDLWTEFSVEVGPVSDVTTTETKNIWKGAHFIRVWIQLRADSGEEVDDEKARMLVGDVRVEKF